MNLTEIYEMDYSLIESIENDNDIDWKSIIHMQPIWQSWDWKEKEITLEKELYNNNLYDYTNFIREISWISYNKFWLNWNLYVLKWAWLKEIDITNILYSLQNQDLSKEEQINLYKTISKIANENIKKIKKEK